MEPITFARFQPGNSGDPHKANEIRRERGKERSQKVIAMIRQMQSGGATEHDIASLLDVNRQTVTRWLAGMAPSSDRITYVLEVLVRAMTYKAASPRERQPGVNTQRYAILLRQEAIKKYR